MRNLLNNTEIQRVLSRNAGTASATAKGTIVDMQGYETATFIVAFQDVVSGAVVDVQVAQSDTNSTGSMVASEAKVNFTAGASDMDNRLAIVEVVNPGKRYLELQVVVATQNAPIDSAVCILSNPSVVPTVQGATVIDSETFVTPEAAS